MLRNAPALTFVFALGLLGQGPETTRHAIELLQQGKSRDAIGELQTIVKRYPAYYPAYSLLGVAYSQLGKPAQAHPYILRAVELAPASLEARINLGANLLAQNKPKEAVAEFNKVVAADPNRLNAWVNLANAYLRLEKRNEANQALERAQRLAPDDLEVQLAAAELNFKTARPDAAMAIVQSLAVVPDPAVQLAVGLLLARNSRVPEAAPHLARYGTADPEGLLALAEKSINESDYPVALALLQAAPDPAKTSAAWHALTGYCLFKRNEPKPALDHLQTAVRLDPANEDYYLLLAEYLGANNAVPAVVTVLETAARALPQSTKIATALSVAYLMQADFGKAESLLLKSLGAAPQDWMSLKLLADCYNRSQNWPKLKDAAARLRKTNANDALGWYYAAQAEYQLLEAAAPGASAQSLQTYVSRAVQLGPNDWKAQILGGKMLLKQNRPSEAAAAFRRAATANPDEPTPHYLLATTLRTLGDAAASKAEFEVFRRTQDKEKERKFRTLVVEIQSR